MPIATALASQRYDPKPQLSLHVNELAPGDEAWPRIQQDGVCRLPTERQHLADVELNDLGGAQVDSSEFDGQRDRDFLKDCIAHRNCFVHGKDLQW